MVFLSREGGDEVSERDGAIAKLWEDKASHSALLKSIYNEMMDSARIMNLPASDQFLVLFSQADFAKSDDERVYVAGIFRKRLCDLDILPRITKHKGVQLAEKGLVSLSFFNEYLESRYGKPAVRFYRGQSVSRFEGAGRFDVAQNFEAWTEYARNLFATA